MVLHRYHYFTDEFLTLAVHGIHRAQKMQSSNKNCKSIVCTIVGLYQYLSENSKEELDNQKNYNNSRNAWRSFLTSNTSTNSHNLCLIAAPCK